MRPLCFVLLPPDGPGFDAGAVERELVAPAARDAGLAPLPAEHMASDGAPDSGLVERLLLCDLAVVDVSCAGTPALAYALGLREGLRPGRTVTLGTAEGPLPGQAYALGPDGRPCRGEADRAALAGHLRRAATAGPTSDTVHRIVDGFPELQRLKTDVFRDRVDYAPALKARLREARAAGVDAVRAVQAELTRASHGLSGAGSGVLVDLLLSLRAVAAWDDMVALVAELPAPLAATPLVQEQLGFALNRAGRPDEAERVLQDVIARRGPSSETCALLGRVHKDRWEAALAAGDAEAARAWLQRAIDTYLQGFEADWRDAYPGVNAVTLMELREPPDPCRTRLIPVVAYAVQRRIATGQPDYWDHATRLELAVLGQDRDGAASALADALAAVREPWEPETTVRNLRLIREARERRGTAPPWCREVEDTLARGRPA